MADKTADAFKFVLRLPKPLHKRLKQQARRNNVSLNTEIVNQLEGSEAATAKRMGEAMKPLVEDAVERAVAEVTGRFPRRQAERLLKMVLGANPYADDPLPADITEGELKKQLNGMPNLPVSTKEQWLEIFRENRAAEAAAKKTKEK